MHVSGKIFAWLTVPAAVAAVFLSVRLLDIRGGWLEQVENLRKDNEEYAGQIEDKEKRVRALQSELERARHEWGDAWPDRDLINLQPADGSIRVRDLGTNHGLGAPDPSSPEPPVVHAFQVQPDGKSEYVGSFQATDLQENDSVLSPTWTLLPGETDGWDRALKWRFRQFIPQAYTHVFPRQYHELNVRTEEISKHQADLATHDTIIADAQKDLAARRAELLGDPAGNPPVAGLVPAIEQEQDLRDREQFEVDRLRRAIHDAWQKLVGLVAGNKELAQALALPKPVTATAGGEGNDAAGNRQ